MRKKVKRFMTCLMAFALVISLVNGEQLSVLAETVETSASTESTADTVAASEEYTEDIPVVLSEDVAEETPAVSEGDVSAVTESPAAAETTTTATETSAAAETTTTATETSAAAETTVSTESGDVKETLDVTESPAATETPVETETAVASDSSETTTEQTETVNDSVKAESESSEVDTEETTEETTEEETTEEETTEEETTEEETTEEETTEEETEEESVEYVPEEQPEGITVKAYAAPGVLPENAKMVVTEISSDDSDVTDALDNSDVEYDGFIALDISFYDGDTEIEPEEGAVQVSFEVDASLLDENADPDSLEVQHLAEDEDGNVVDVQTVADTADATEGTVELKSDESVVTAAFEVESFSSFVITYRSNTSETVTVYLYDENGNEIEAGSELSGTTIEENNWYALSRIAASYKITGYSYSSAKAGSSYQNASEVKWIKYSNSNRKGSGWRTSNDNNSPGNNQNGSALNGNIYLIYEKVAVLKTFKGLDTSKNITINVYDYEKNSVNEEYFPFGGEGWTGNGGGVKQGLVRSKLGDDGYPVLSSDQPLNYLFNGNRASTSVKGANYLFQMDDEGYYYYNSKINYAKLDTDNNEFDLYYVPHSANSDSDSIPPAFPQFLPFNTLTGKLIETTADDNHPAYYYELGEDANYFFGMDIGFDFIQPKNGLVDGKEMVFEFEGDDDVWVFIDDVLVLDMGGVHDNYAGSINFATGEVKVNSVNGNGTNNDPKTTTIADMFTAAGKTWDGSDYSSHSLRFFYLERGAGGSNCKIKFNLQTIPKGTINFQKHLEYANVADAADIDFQFKVFVDYDGDGEDYSLYTGNYQVFDADNLDTPLRIGGVGSDGIITLKDGQVARLNDERILETSLFYVQEIGATSDKYEVTVNNVKIETIEESGITTETGVQTEELKVKDKPHIVFNNKVVVENQFNLVIKKQMAGNQTSDDTFSVKVLLGKDTQLPYTGKYNLYNNDDTLVSANLTASTDGIITLKANQYVEIVGLIGGNKIQVQEVDYSAEKYNTPIYAVSGALADQGVVEEHGVWAIAKEGKELGTDPKVEVTVTNSTKFTTLTVKKVVDGNMADSDQAFDFTLTLEKDTAKYTVPLAWTKNEVSQNVLAVSEDTYRFSLKSGDVAVFNVPVGYTYSVTENKLDYTAVIKVNGAERSAATGTIESPTEVEFTNTKNVVPPTGIRTNARPHTMMLFTAFAALFVLALTKGCRFSKRRNRE
ncbi:MAG: fibro-slime domain-containing protein [Lachnospiraceae bacterium]|nr:fibro-slime domain-containing protein [Lachnospiraceae bacterium]